MEKRLGRFAAASFAAALVLEGCSNVSSPTPTQSETKIPTQNPSAEVDNIVNCQADKFDDQVKTYRLKNGQAIRIGGITKKGEQESIKINVRGDQIGITPETNSFDFAKVEGSFQLKDKNLFIIIRSSLEGNATVLGVSMTCIDALPKTPQA